MTTSEILDRAVAAKRTLVSLTEEKKNLGLHAMAEALLSNTDAILSANAIDMERAKETLGRSGRIVARPSGTEPLIRVMVEGMDTELIESVATDVANVIKARLSNK